MKRLLLFGAIGLAALLLIGGLAALGTRIGAPSGSLTVEARAGPTLARFGSAEAFRAYADSIPELRRRAMAAEITAEPSAAGITDFAADDAAAMPMEAANSAETGPPAGQATFEITNNQVVGVDEGGIVKQVGHFLVILQDGRLFSADLGAAAGAPLRLAGRIDVYRSRETAADWYDEMVVHGDRILVTAYNYTARATEIAVFRIDAAGGLTREARYLLTADDYYTTENYATRIVGDNLVFYSVLSIAGAGPDGDRWPRLRRADGEGGADRGRDLIGPTQVYAPLGEILWPAIHSVSVCPLARDMDCRTTTLVGPPTREFYVSPTDAFLWLGAPDGLPWSIDYGARRRHACPSGHSWVGRGDSSALLYRVPLDGSAIGAVAVEGVPANQFAFDSRDGRFRALLSRPGAGCSSFEKAAPLTLLDLPLTDFGAQVRRASGRAYSTLPAVGADRVENRFVGVWLVYGGHFIEGVYPTQREVAERNMLIAVPLARPSAPIRLTLPHNVIRIDRAGGDAVVTGYRGRTGLSLSYVSLAGARPRLAATTLLPHRFESESRSHAFSAWMRADGSGLIGLPTTTDAGRSERGWSDSQSSELSFVAVGTDKALAGAGELAPSPGPLPPPPYQQVTIRGVYRGSYRCEVSCVDWYGNSRPIFTGGRIFALMGTDLVEGRMAGGRIGEVGRLDLTGAPPPGGRAGAR